MSAEIILLAKYVLATLAGVPTTLAGIHHKHYPVTDKDLLLVVAFVAALSPAACSNCILCSLPAKKQHAMSELSLSLCWCAV